MSLRPAATERSATSTRKAYAAGEGKCGLQSAPNRRERRQSVVSGASPSSARERAAEALRRAAPCWAVLRLSLDREAGREQPDPAPGPRFPDQPGGLAA